MNNISITFILPNPAKQEQFWSY